MVSAKVISFDLDGTLIDYGFVDSVWFEGVPLSYSVEKRVSFDDAREAVKREYDRVGKDRLKWYDLSYWTRKLGLNIAAQEILQQFENRIKLSLIHI